MLLISNYASEKNHTLYIYFDGHMLFNNDDVDVTDNWLCTVSENSNSKYG